MRASRWAPRLTAGFEPWGYSLVEMVCSAAVTATLSWDRCRGLRRPSTTLAGDRRGALRVGAPAAGSHGSGRAIVGRGAAVRLDADGSRPLGQRRGNGNGVRTMDIQRRSTRADRRLERLRITFEGVEVRLCWPACGRGRHAARDGPHQAGGSSNIASFSASGTSSPGSFYIRRPAACNTSFACLEKPAGATS